MRILLAALVAFALVYPRAVAAQQQVVSYKAPPYAEGSLTTTNDAVTIAAPGASWATVQWVVRVAGTATVTTEVSIDGGTNWLASAYSKRIDAVSANPSTAPWSNNTPVAGTYEVPLPANATHFRVRCGNTGTATFVAIQGGQVYSPGMPVIATLYDVTSAVNTLNGTGVLDMSGWVSYVAEFSAGGATTVALIGATIADDGVNVRQTSPAAYSAGTGSTFVAAATAGSYKASRLGDVTTATAFTKRMAFSLAATAAQATRLRIEAYR